ncbi:DMT family transporter [Anianabacter salinae]|uniref:DMT family transporter n=1 Tax=Anianabacter salinae TaxID=2851023 RepID=UPI00225E0ADB|nr:DMT family transporter [Anianabacter salinae]MBV0913597.1 DMT family transporter [Anianabacter salinae]
MQPLRGILLMISAVSLFLVMSAFIKEAGRIPAGEAVFFRSAASLPVVIVWLVWLGNFPAGLRTANWKGHAVRGIAGSCAMGLGFAGLRYLPLPEVTAIRFATPILIVLFAALILGERLRLIRLSAVLVGLVGVMVVMWPRLSLEGGEGALFGAIVTLGSATLAALAQIFVKSMSARENTAAIVFYFTLTAATLSLFTVPFGWVMPQGIEWVWLIGAGVIGGIGQILLTSSYRFADAGVLAPFTYVSMIWAIIVGYFWFNEVPTVPMLLGAALVIAAGVAIVLRERQLGLRTAAERKVRAKGIQ